MVYFARTHMHQDAPDNEEALPQQKEPRYSPNMLEGVWPELKATITSSPFMEKEDIIMSSSLTEEKQREENRPLIKIN
jgi:hypothetical protein